MIPVRKQRHLKKFKWPNSFQMNQDLNVIFTKDSGTAYDQE